MEGLLYVWKVINKTIKKYTAKDWQEGIEHTIKLAVFWASLLVRASEKVFDKLEKGKTYTIPVWSRVFVFDANWDKKAGISWYIRTWDILDNETWEIVDIEK